ncbi:MAG: hypothetical protein HQ575_07135 [Candidatus Omnitrophica bacterium]|nr:hypothetical protein [Candidatus Omnitrophota bacterium]
MKDECVNYLRLEGDEREIKRFVLQAKADYGDGQPQRFLLDNFIPFPKEFCYVRENDPSGEIKAKLPLKYRFDDLDEWCMANWGTPTDAWDFTYNEKTDTYEFVAGCYPPVVGIIRISQLYPTLKFIYEYENFRDPNKRSPDHAKFIFKNGEVLHEKYGIKLLKRRHL